MEVKRTSPCRLPGAPAMAGARARSRRGGFSLAELLISVGILSIGLSMCAMLFPAALKENERSLNNVLGTLICENTLSLGRVALNADNPDTSGGSEVESTTLQDRTSTLGSGNRYPWGDAGKLGCILLARKIEQGGYQLVAVAYRKSKAGNAIEIRSPNCTVNNGSVNCSASDLRVGSFLISQASGEFGRLASVSADHRTGQLEPKATFSGNCMVLLEKEGGSLLETSPALWVLSTKTGLRLKK